MASFDKNIKGIESHLDVDEIIEASVFGVYETKIMGKDSIRSGVLIATGKRLCFYAKKIIGFEFESFPYSHISSFEHGKGLMGHKIKFFASGNNVTIKWINKGDIKKLTEVVGREMGKKHIASEKTGSSDGVYEKIKKLQELKDKNMIDTEEFDKKKKDLLDRI